MGWVGTRVLLCISGWPGTLSQLGDFIRPWMFPFLLYPGNFFSLRRIIWNWIYSYFSNEFESTGYIEKFHVVTNTSNPIAGMKAGDTRILRTLPTSSLGMCNGE